ncbi:MAG: DJ-1/PfpI family protein [Roseburia sp.]|nr:DJ-1/PfpI family protein [Anaeroplasma bactoclasticum]MCM1196126.1 DJ-1/PfpI family protein [Roseburia sp.]MCM1557123.1 DJ-1/PfpI family protein [Anaeroplasma bactoclasticum]
MKVLAIIFDGFEELEGIAPFALLRRAGLDLTIVSNRSDVVGVHYLHLTDISLINEVDYKAFDALLLPGGPHYRFMENFGYALEIIKFFMENDKVVCAICAAPTILGHLGYLKNKNYTCFTCMNEDFGGSYIDKKVVVDGNLITARSAAASIEFAYEIIRKLAGTEALLALKKRIYDEE